MAEWNKPYPPSKTLLEQHPELHNVCPMIDYQINQLITTDKHYGSSTHHYKEKENGTISIESEMWYVIAKMSDRVMQMCNHEQPDLLCVTMTVGEFSNGSDRIYQYSSIGKYLVNVRFYKLSQNHMILFAHDDEKWCEFPNIKVGEYNGILHNLIHPDDRINESNITETKSTPFTKWNVFWGH